MSAAIETTGLAKRYRRRVALSDCTLSIPTGKVVGLVGPNGAGKSTLLHLAVGLLAPSAGRIRVLGHPPAEGPEQLGRVGFVAQDTPVYDGMFAFALGATTGLLFRKTLPAMAATAATFVGVRLAVTYWVRPYLEAPLKKNLKLGPNAFAGFVMTPTGVKVAPPSLGIPNAWVLSTTLADKAGNPPTGAFLNKACPTVASGPRGAVQVVHALGNKGAVPARGGTFQHCIAAIETTFHGIATYQPASRYWPFQLCETALFVVLALVLGGGSYWWVRRRLSAG